MKENNTSVKVLLDTIKKVQDFNHAATKCNFDLDLLCGRYVVDGKSLMGMLSLDLEQPIKLRFNNKYLGVVENTFEKWIVPFDETDVAINFIK